MESQCNAPWHKFSVIGVRDCSSAKKAKPLLGVASNEDSIVATAGSLARLGLV
jgi:hypothetical protein